MKLIVGLGNPGRKYEQTRHNIGFMVAAQLCREYGGSSPSKKFDGETSDIRIGSEKALILCPQTYMNASGQSVRQAMDFYKLNPPDLVLICAPQKGRLQYNCIITQTFYFYTSLPPPPPVNFSPPSPGGAAQNDSSHAGTVDRAIAQNAAWSIGSPW